MSDQSQNPEEGALYVTICTTHKIDVHMDPDEYPDPTPEDVIAYFNQDQGDFLCDLNHRSEQDCDVVVDYAEPWTDDGCFDTCRRREHLDSERRKQTQALWARFRAGKPIFEDEPEPQDRDVVREGFRERFQGKVKARVERRQQLTEESKAKYPHLWREEE